MPTAASVQSSGATPAQEDGSNKSDCDPSHNLLLKECENIYAQPEILLVLEVLEPFLLIYWTQTNISRAQLSNFLQI